MAKFNVKVQLVMINKLVGCIRCGREAGDLIEADLVVARASADEAWAEVSAGRTLVRGLGTSVEELKGKGAIGAGVLAEFLDAAKAQLALLEATHYEASCLRLELEARLLSSRTSIEALELALCACESEGYYSAALVDVHEVW